MVKKADARIAELCRQRGIPEEFRPEIYMGFMGRGENGSKERRAELRKVAQAQVAARVKEAQVAIDRQATEHMTQVTRAALTSEQAILLLDAMPAPEQLLPAFTSLEVCGRVVHLPEAVTDATDKPVTVTPKIACAFCHKPINSARADSKYCRSACRTADYRRRKSQQGD
jgi:hypothetical protein